MKKVYVSKLLNYIFFVIGLGIVWFSTYNLIAILGTTIASIHITFIANE